MSAIIAPPAEVFQLIDTFLASAGQPLLVSIDGPSGSGKTTLASQLSEHYQAPVVHMDDFYIPMREKTPERLAIPGGNADWERLEQEFLRPWRDSGCAVYRPYLCHEDQYKAAITVENAPLVFLEGSYANLPQISKYVDLKIWLSITPQEQEKRLTDRVGAELFPWFRDKWITLETRYHKAYHLPSPDCVVFTTAAETR